MASLEKECKWHFAEHLGGREDGLGSTDETDSHGRIGDFGDSLSGDGCQTDR